VAFPNHHFSKLGLSNSIIKKADTAKSKHQWSAVGKSNKGTSYPHVKFCQANSVLIDEVHRWLIKATIALKLGERNFVFIKDATAYHHALE
jgi:hypothetical protein